MIHKIQFEREKTALKYFLIGRGYKQAIKALGFAERLHVGMRKDGKTPEFHHQVRIALSVSQMRDLLHEERSIVVSLLHDVLEDYPVTREDLEREFGAEVADSVWRMTKKTADLIKQKTTYMSELALDPVSSIVKGCDRTDNLQTMIDVFSVEKMTSYAEEARSSILPMLKRASKFFPEQIHAYQAVTLTIKRQLQFIKNYIDVQLALELASDQYKKVKEDLAKMTKQRDDWSRAFSQESADHTATKKLLHTIKGELVELDRRIQGLESFMGQDYNMEKCTGDINRT